MLVFIQWLVLFYEYVIITFCVYHVMDIVSETKIENVYWSSQFVARKCKQFWTGMILFSTFSCHTLYDRQVRHMLMHCSPYDGRPHWYCQSIVDSFLLYSKYIHSRSDSRKHKPHATKMQLFSCQSSMCTCSVWSVNMHSCGLTNVTMPKWLELQCDHLLSFYTRISIENKTQSFCQGVVNTILSSKLTSSFDETDCYVVI